MDFKISDTNKGKKSLIYDGFIYRIDSVLKCGDIPWRCTNKKCKGRLRTDSAMSTMNGRSHLPTFKIIRTELHKFADKLTGSGDVRSIAQSLYR